MRLKLSKRKFEGLFLIVIVLGIGLSLFMSEGDVEFDEKMTGFAIFNWGKLKECLKEYTLIECLSGEDYFIKPNKKHWIDRLEKLKKRCTNESDRIICKALNKDKLYVINESYQPPPGSIMLEAEELIYYLSNNTKCYGGLCNVVVMVVPKIPDTGFLP